MWQHQLDLQSLSITPLYLPVTQLSSGKRWSLPIVSSHLGVWSVMHPFEAYIHAAPTGVFDLLFSYRREQHIA